MPKHFEGSIVMDSVSAHSDCVDVLSFYFQLIDCMLVELHHWFDECREILLAI